MGPMERDRSPGQGRQEQGPPCAPRVIGEGTGWICIDKPEGWHSVEVRDSDGAPTVQGWLRATMPALAAQEECGLAHRLDKWTGGCLVAATDPQARDALRAAFGGRGGPALRKWYLALVAPGLREDGQWELHFASRYARSAKVSVSARGDGATRGTCAWRIVRHARNTGTGRHGVALDPLDLDLVEIELVGPGRRHQIRAGFASLGHPLAGDGLYSGAALAGRGTDRPALHASRIEIDGHAVAATMPSWCAGAAG